MKNKPLVEELCDLAGISETQFNEFKLRSLDFKDRQNLIESLRKNITQYRNAAFGTNEPGSNYEVFLCIMAIVGIMPAIEKKIQPLAYKFLSLKAEGSIGAIPKDIDESINEFSDFLCNNLFASK